MPRLPLRWSITQKPVSEAGRFRVRGLWLFALPATDAPSSKKSPTPPLGQTGSLPLGASAMPVAL